LVISFLARPNILCAILKRVGILKQPLIINEVTPPDSHKRLERVMIRRFYPLANQIVVPSESLKEYLVTRMALPPAKIAVIPNPVDSSAIRRRALQDPVEPFLGDCATPTLISAGRLVPVKGFTYLLEAFRLVRNQIRCRLVILGEGDQKEALQSLAGKLSLTQDVRFLGWQANPFSYFKRADLFVSSSLWEAFGNVLVEAMCCGLPVVGFSCPGGPREILGDNRYGVLVPVGDTKALAEAVLRLLTDQNLYVHYRQQSLDRSRDFEIEKVAAQWQKIIAAHLKPTVSIT
jgi:glycosyltransferase involved in cell wall biosynthesis